MSASEQLLLQMVYVSAAVTPMGAAELETLLVRARAKNARLDITGLLLYHDGSFLQVLEGPEENVKTLYATIARDPRHHRHLVPLKRPVGERAFAEWTMGLVWADATDPDRMAGMDDYLQGGMLGLAEDSARVERLLEGFRGGLWRQAIS